MKKSSFSRTSSYTHTKNSNKKKHQMALRQENTAKPARRSTAAEDKKVLRSVTVKKKKKKKKVSVMVTFRGGGERLRSLCRCGGGTRCRPWRSQRCTLSSDKAETRQGVKNTLAQQHRSDGRRLQASGASQRREMENLTASTQNTKRREAAAP